MTKKERLKRLTQGVAQEDVINRILIEAIILHIKKNGQQADFCENVKGMWKNLMNHESFEDFRRQLRKLDFNVFDIFSDKQDFTPRFEVIDRISSLFAKVLGDSDQKGFIMGYCLCGIIHKQN